MGTGSMALEDGGVAVSAGDVRWSFRSGEHVC